MSKREGNPFLKGAIEEYNLPEDTTLGQAVGAIFAASSESTDDPAEAALNAVFGGSSGSGELVTILDRFLRGGGTKRRGRGR